MGIIGWIGRFVKYFRILGGWCRGYQLFTRKTRSSLSSKELRKLASRSQLYYLGSMNTIKNLLTNLCNLLVCACEAFRYGLTFLRAILCPRAVLAAKLPAVESQLAVCKQRIDSKKRRRPRFTASFRLLWVVLSKFLDEWEYLVHLMQPATVKKRHTMRLSRANSTMWHLV